MLPSIRGRNVKYRNCIYKCRAGKFVSVSFLWPFSAMSDRPKTHLTSEHMSFIYRELHCVKKRKLV